MIDKQLQQGKCPACGARTMIYKQLQQQGKCPACELPMANSEQPVSGYHRICFDICVAALAADIEALALNRLDSSKSG